MVTKVLLIILTLLPVLGFAIGQQSQWGAADLATKRLPITAFPRASPLLYKSRREDFIVD